MGYSKDRKRESLNYQPKRRKICDNLMPREEKLSSTILGPKGLVKRDEFVRVITQCLYSLGLTRSASCLESESGILLRSKELEELEEHILDANWEDCISTINGIKGLPDEIRSSALLLVFKQYLMEYLGHGDYKTALSILQKRVSELNVGKDKVHSLALDVLSAKEARNENIDPERSCQDLPGKLLVELKNLLPPPIMLPDNRLEHLVEMAINSQIDSCLYHNSMVAVSLYEDHSCGRDQIPTQTVQMLTEHNNEVWFVQFSHCGEYLATSSSDCTAIIWKVPEDGEFSIVHTLRSHQNPVSFVTWSPDDTMILTCGNLEVVKLWDVETGTCTRTFGDEGFIAGSCAWFPDSRNLVCGSSEPEKGICMWDVDGNEIRVWKGPRMPKVLDLVVTSDGKNLISVFSDKEIRILDVATSVERVIAEEHPITSLAVSPDGKHFLVNLNSQEIHMWDVAGEWVKPLRYTGHKQQKYVIRSCFGGWNSAFIASGSENSEVFIWNRQRSEPIEILRGHSKTVNCVSWNPRRPRMLASASDDQTVRIWGPVQSSSSSSVMQPRRILL